MVFVWSYWYIVLAILAIGAIGCVIAFVMMDKKDRQLMHDFVKQNTQPVEEKKPETVVIKVSQPVEQVVESQEVKAEDKTESQDDNSNESKES